MDRRRLIRYVFGGLPALALVALLFGALFLAGDAEADVSRLGRWSPWLYGGALAALIVLIAAIARQLWQLAAAWRARAPGSRLATRWTIALVLLAVPPVVLVYAFSIKFLNTTIDTWFNVRVERALDDALSLGRLFLDAEVDRARVATAEQVETLRAMPRESWQTELEDAADRGGALQLAIFGDAGAVLASVAADPRLLIPAPPDDATLLRVRGGAVEAVSEPLGDDLVVRVVRALDGATVLQAIYALPTRAQPLAQNIQSSWHDYQRLNFLRSSLKLTFTLILSAVLLLSLLLAVLAALRVAHRQVRPVADLARATQEVAAGKFDRELAAGGDDEIGFLTVSFNRMIRQLADASRATRESQAETERERAHLQTVLERLSTGVLSFDADGRLNTANAAADTLLGVALEPWLERPLADLGEAHPRLAPLTRLLTTRAIEGAREWREEVRLGEFAPDDTTAARVLMVRGAALPPEVAGEERRARGYVAVFDDQTVLNQIQREAAWSEVARRLAHEIKNPLTPIQLAAERVKHRLRGKLTPDDAAVLDKATHTIVAQVEALKSMVNAFGDYARPPQLQLAPLKLNGLVGEVLDLYEADARVQLTRALDVGDPQIRGDAGRLRQLLHNLIKNAIEASPESARIEVSTRIEDDADARRVILIVSDHGAGLPAGFDESWFEPYRTSKVKGTGLGLAVVRKVAEEHGGSVRAEARPGGGASFIVALPRAA